LKLREAPPPRADLAGPKVSHYRVVPVADDLALIEALTDSFGVRCVVEKARDRVERLRAAPDIADEQLIAQGYADLPA